LNRFEFEHPNYAAYIRVRVNRKFDIGHKYLDTFLRGTNLKECKKKNESNNMYFEFIFKRCA